MQGSDFWASATSIPMEIEETDPTPSAALTREAGELYSGWGRSAWWRITATETVELSFNLLKSTLQGEYTWCAIALFQPNGSGGLNLVGRTDYNDYIQGSDLPELLYTVTAGEVYFIQASLRDGYPNVDYVLQVGKVTYTETGWLDGGIYEHTPTGVNVLTYRQAWLAFNAGAGGEPVETSLTDYTQEPNPDTAIEAFNAAAPHQFINMQVVGSAGNAQIYTSPAGNKPNPDYNGINSPILADWTRYSGRGTSSMWGQRRYKDLSQSPHYQHYAPPPPGALSVTYERPLPKVLKLMVQFEWSIGVYNSEQPGTTGSTFVAEVVTPPADDGSDTVDPTALKQEEWSHGAGQGTRILEASGADMTAPERMWVDVTPHISEAGGYLIRCYIEPGAWDPIPGAGGNYNLSMAGDIMPVNKIYTLQAPRTKYTVRKVGGQAELPEPTGRPDLVRRRFVRA